MRERESGRHRGRQTDRETNRQRQRKTDKGKQRSRQTETQRETQRERERDRERGRQRETETYKAAPVCSLQLFSLKMTDSKCWKHDWQHFVREENSDKEYAYTHPQHTRTVQAEVYEYYVQRPIK